MAIKVDEAARGNAPATGMPKTPAPTKRTTLAGPDVISQEKSSGGTYGQNHYTGASSTNPGQRVQSDMGNAIAVDDPVLDAMIAGGARNLHGANDWQERAVNANSSVPLHPAMSKRGPADGSPGGTVPSKTGASVFDANSIRKPGQ